jgi:TolB-like protein/tetratricopeptide (TPR) repeat protein/predicted Ser/Thr protein kinase
MALSVGDKLGPYEILSTLGAGGMGDVYKAIDTRLGRLVAIKIAKTEFDGRFRREARAVATLNHPNICTLHDVGPDYLVMELVDGETLAERLRGGPVPADESLRLCIQIAEALEAAHAKGITHRDIKPANIKVTPEGRVKILDFGLAKMESPWGGAAPADADATCTAMTQAGVVMGTPAYMSPEQVRGEVVDPRCDVWAFGCVLFELLSGRRIFQEVSTADMVAAILRSEPRWDMLPPDVPAQVLDVLRRCLSKNAQARPQQISEARAGLDQALRTPASERSPGLASQTAVAVMPFQMRTEGSEDQFLSIALADAVIHRLTATGKLVVRPIASVLRHKNADAEWQQVARELGVDVVVRGAIQKIGARVRVLVQTCRVSDSTILHSAQHDGDVKDLFAFQDHIAESVSAVFAQQGISAPQRLGPPTKSALAYELYLRAVDRLVQMGKFDTEMAVEMLRQVIEHDSNFADAWGRLAQACTMMATLFDGGPSWLERADEAIARTLELDPIQGDALCARGQILWSPARGFQNRAALRALSASLKIRPNQEVARQYRAAILLHLGFYDEAERDLTRALLVNPGYVLAGLSRGFIAHYRGDYETAQSFFDRVLSLNPGGVHANLVSALPAIFMGRLADARNRLAKARQVAPEEPELAAQEALILAHEGNFRKAEELADLAVVSKKSLTHTHHTWHDAAGVYAMCGQPEKAIVQLRRCAQEGLPNCDLFQSDPHLGSLQGRRDFLSFIADLRREADRYEEEFDLTSDRPRA